MALKSGGILPLGVRLFDEENRVVSIDKQASPSSFHFLITSEISELFFEVEVEAGSTNVEIKGESVISAK